MYRPLNATEREFAEEHFEEIEWFLRRRGLDYSEFFDVVVFGYIDAVIEYLSSEKARNYKFATIAKVKMRDALSTHHRNQNRKKRKANVLSLDTQLFIAGVPLEDIIEDTKCIPQSQQVSDKQLIKQCLSVATDAQKQVLALKSQGYSYREIGALFGITGGGAYSRIFRFRRRLRLTYHGITR